METGNELNGLLKKLMQFDEGELPELNSGIQKRLRKRVTARKTGKSKFLGALKSFFDRRDIKLYYAGIAVSAVVLIFVVLRNTNEVPKHKKSEVIVADTNTGSNPRDDSFQVKNDTFRIY